MPPFAPPEPSEDCPFHGVVLPPYLDLRNADGTVFSNALWTCLDCDTHPCKCRDAEETPMALDDDLTPQMIEALRAVAHGKVTMSWVETRGIHVSTHMALEDRGLVKAGEPLAIQPSPLAAATYRHHAVVLTEAGRELWESLQ